MAENLNVMNVKKKKNISKNKVVEKSHLYSVESCFIFCLYIQRGFFVQLSTTPKLLSNLWFLHASFCHFLTMDMDYGKYASMCLFVELRVCTIDHCTRHTDKTWFVELRDNITMKIAEIMLFSCNFFNCLMWIVTDELFVDKLSI